MRRRANDTRREKARRKAAAEAQEQQARQEHKSARWLEEDASPVPVSPDVTDLDGDKLQTVMAKLKDFVDSPERDIPMSRGKMPS